MTYQYCFAICLRALILLARNFSISADIDPSEVTKEALALAFRDFALSSPNQFLNDLKDEYPFEYHLFLETLKNKGRTN